jgi:hypothetical protein
MSGWRRVSFLLVLCNFIFFLPPLPLPDASVSDPAGQPGSLALADMDASTWHLNDKRHIEELVANSNNPGALSQNLAREWYALHQELQQLFLGGDDLWPSIYPPRSSAKIQAVNGALFCREDLLLQITTGQAPLRVNDPDPFRGRPKAGFPLGPALEFRPASPLSIDRTPLIKAVVAALPLPAETFQELSIYLLPNDYSGYAALSFSQGRPGRDEMICVSARAQRQPAYLEGVIMHELGHFMHYKYLQNDPAKKREFQSLLGASLESSISEDETFAEWFRMAFGSADAKAAFQYRGAAPCLPGEEKLNQFGRWLQEVVAAESATDDLCDWQARVELLAAPVSLSLGIRPEQSSSIITTGNHVSLEPARGGKLPAGCIKLFLYDLHNPAGAYLKPLTYKEDRGLSFDLPGPGVYAAVLSSSDPPSAASIVAVFDIIALPPG